MPVKFPELAGKPYRPSNGTEGEMFMGIWCDYCEREAKYRQTGDGEDSCPIAGNAVCYDITSEHYPVEWIYDANGEPTCTAFIEEGNPLPAKVSENQMMLGFGGSKSGKNHG